MPLDDLIDDLPTLDDPHKLRALVAECLEVFATTFVMLTENDPPSVDLAANEVQQAYKRIAAALSPSPEVTP